MTAKIGCFAGCVLLGGCGQIQHKAGAAEQLKSPFAYQIPKDPPDEKYRVSHPAGYSIVYPSGWKTQVDHYADWRDVVDGLGTDRRGVSGKEDFGKASLSIQRFSETGKKAILSGNWFKDMKAVQFQNQPAWAKFDPGSLPAKRSLDNLFSDAMAGYPYLTQQLLFERNGEWFMLSFQMRNIKGRKGPYYSDPLQALKNTSRPSNINPQARTSSRFRHAYNHATTASPGCDRAVLGGGAAASAGLVVRRLQEHVMRPLRYSINVTFDGCCDHRVGVPDEELHRHAVETLSRADALLFGRVTYEMMEAAFRPAWTGEMPDWMEAFRRTIDAAKKYVVSSTLKRVDWNAELVRGDLAEAVQKLKQEPGKGLYVGGVKLPLALAELGLIDEYEFVVQPRLVGHGPTLFAGLSKHLDLKLVSRLEFASGAVTLRYEPKRLPLG
jgi:dihydrofolate reductase